MNASCPTCSHSNPYVLGSRPKFCMNCGNSMIAVASAPTYTPPPQPAPYYTQPAPYYTQPPARHAPIPKLTVRAEIEAHKGIKFEQLTQLGPVEGSVGVRQGQEGFASLKDLEAQSRAECARRVIEIGGDES